MNRLEGYENRCILFLMPRALKSWFIPLLFITLTDMTAWTADSTASNLRFFAAQTERLQREVGEQKRIEASWLGYRGWERDAAKKIRVEKERTLKMIEELKANPPQYSVKCLSDISPSGLSAPSADLLGAANHTYSKAGGGGYVFESRCSDPDCVRRQLLNNSDSLSFDYQQLARILADDQVSRESVIKRDAPIPGKASGRVPGLTAVDRKALTSFGIKNWMPAGQCRDLSGRFSTPKLQPPHTAKCAGYAVASDMEEVMNRRKIWGQREVSPEYTYVALTMGESQVPGKEGGLCSLLGTYVDPLMGIASITESLNRKPTVCNSEIPDKAKHQYTVGGVTSAKFEATEKPSSQFLKALIDNGIAPMVTVSSEARKELENWIYPSAGGGYKHVINVVGYCRGQDPNCLEDQDYFIVRDSLGKKPVHYRVPAAALARQIEAVDKISSVTDSTP